MTATRRYPRFRGPKDWPREALPIGTIRLRQREHGKVRVIKVRLDGPKSRRWVNYARWWWETQRGPVPAGKRVAHLDGDMLNDDPSNYGLLSGGDVIYLAHERDPAMAARNRINCARATAEANVVRALAHRMMHWLPTMWYGVDIAGRRIFNSPFRERWQVYAAHGLEAGPGNWRAVRCAALGWPTLPYVIGHGRLKQACILSVLAALNDWAMAGAVITAVGELRALHGWSPLRLSRRCFYTAVWASGDRVLVRRRGSRPALFRIAPSALGERRPPCPVIPMRGDRLAAHDGFADFERIIPPAGGGRDEP